MFKKLKNHEYYYLSLFLILFFGFLLAFLSSDKQFQMLVIVVTSFSYVGWGILHHYLYHELSPKIMVEYVLIGAFGATVIFFLLKGGFGL